MKSLKESLFDSNLVSQKLPYEKLLKGRISRDDILSFIDGWEEGDFLGIKNSNFREWSHEFYNKEPVLKAGYYTWNSKNNISQEAIDWLKPGKVHTKVTWNDCMYANSLDVSWKFWGSKINSDNITEWILINKNDRGLGIRGVHTRILVNRKEYSEFDQAMIHKLIETISK